MIRYRNAVHLPVPEMPADWLARYRRVPASPLRRCREEHPQYRQMSACLADVPAGERAAGWLAVPPETRCWRPVSACE